MDQTQRFPDRPQEVTAAFESLRDHLKAVAHIKAITTFDTPNGSRYWLSVIAEPVIRWELVPSTWGYEVEHLLAGDASTGERQP